MKKEKFKMPPKKFRKLVMDAAREYRWLLHREDYTFKTSWSHEDEKRGEEDYCAAKIDVDRRYMMAHMTIYPFVWKDWIAGSKTDEDVKKIVAHEISHMATQHVVNLMYSAFCNENEVKDAWESLTELIGQLLYKLDTRK